MAKNKKGISENEKKVAEKTYDVSDYQSTDPVDQGLAITHEQVSDDYMEGTIDAKINKVNKDDELESHQGKDIPRTGF